MTPFNQEQAEKFLADNNIKSDEIKKVAGDASFRSYYRIYSGEDVYILMFAPPPHEDIKPFEKIDKFLIENNFSAPKIHARDEKIGFLLLEDFGDDTYSRVLAKDNSSELEIYTKALDVLLELHEIKPPQDVKNYNHATLFREVMLFVDWYLKLKNQLMSQQEIAHFKFLWFQLFDLISTEGRALTLRDYHADNLMLLGERSSSQMVGLLDFQDALIGPGAYDVVSLLEDARRDLDTDNRQKLLQYYLDNSQIDKNNFQQDYEILSLQRNIKIVGIFARLSIRDGKSSYLNMIPRVVDFIESRLNSDQIIFSEIKILLKKFL
jgi:aminoglycoside/choline kinase family phosphotransferase